jgi:hypothetical protein
MIIRDRKKLITFAGEDMTITMLLCSNDWWEPRDRS